ncbi:hypothetical protein, partial [Bradyrhizobium liaoningense]
IRSKNPRRCQAENPLKLLSEFAGPALRRDPRASAMKPRITIAVKVDVAAILFRVALIISLLS